MYTNARVNKKSETIDVVERVNDKRLFTSYPIDYSFYISSPNGEYRSIYGDAVTKVVPKSSTEFHKEVAMMRGKKIWESDINPIFKCLAEYYKGKAAPKLNIAFFDIEVDFSNEKGYAPIEDPFNKITSITIYLKWTNQLITLAIPPDSVELQAAQDIAAKFDNTIIFTDESQMIDAFFQLIDDADVITGWNSEGFDIPYLINRVARIMSKDDTRRMCLWGEKPKIKTIEKYGKEFNSYELVGRTHLDLMDVYRKFTYEERHSYSLNAIAEHELGKSKTPYSGSLDKLYNDDFEKFIEYNRQDVILLYELEDKLKFLDLLNVLAHKTKTLMVNCMGTVAMTDQAIINRAHELGLVVPNKGKYGEADDDGAAGAYVAQPKAGIHEYVGVIDINSLYPSTIRALNMGIETIVGQLRPVLTDFFIAEKFRTVKNMTYANAWQDQFGSQEYQAVMEQKAGVDITIDWEHNGKSDTLTAKQCHDLIFNSGKPWMISGNGTIFSYERNAIIPGLLAAWYKDRKDFQQQKKDAADLQYGITLSKNCLDQLSDLTIQ